MEEEERFGLLQSSPRKYNRRDEAITRALPLFSGDGICSEKETALEIFRYRNLIIVFLLDLPILRFDTRHF